MTAEQRQKLFDYFSQEHGISLMDSDFNEIENHFNKSGGAAPVDVDWEKQVQEASESECIYQPKYGGKDRSGYDTMMLYEVNDQRQDAFVNGANWAKAALQSSSDAAEKHPLVGYWFADDDGVDVTVLAVAGEWCMCEKPTRSKPFALSIEFVQAIKNDSEEELKQSKQ